MERAERTIWYASIGSMMNQTSLEMRKVHPAESVPCILDGYRRVFGGLGRGMATLAHDPTASTCVTRHAMRTRPITMYAL
jgi:hypothetical protein